MAGGAPGYGKTCRQDVLRGVDVPLPGLESRIPGALSEERRVRDLLVADRLLERDGRHLVQPRQFVRGLHGGQVGVRLGESRPGLICLVPLMPPGQGLVPDHADAAERAVQHAGLHLVRIRTALVRRPHRYQAYVIQSEYINVTRREGGGVSSPPGDRGLHAAITMTYF